jgi:hypothetical protein
MARSRVPATGSFRLQVRTPRGWVRIGNFQSLTRVEAFARELFEGRGGHPSRGGPC